MNEMHAGREAGRAGWWAVLRTERDRRLAVAGGRPITARNLRRLLMRRLGRAFGQPIEAKRMNEFVSRFWDEGRE